VFCPAGALFVLGESALVSLAGGMPAGTKSSSLSLKASSLQRDDACWVIPARADQGKKESVCLLAGGHMVGEYSLLAPCVFR
jgi:hypothetical protein